MKLNIGKIVNFIIRLIEDDLLDIRDILNHPKTSNELKQSIVDFLVSISDKLDVMKFEI